MKKQFLAAVILSAVAVSPVLAADMYKATGAGFDWSGFYAGVLSGYGFGNGASTTSGTVTDVPLRGALLGATVGVNHQIDDYLLGVEGDIAWSGQSGSATCVRAPGFTCSGNLGWVGSVRGRVGYTMDSVLLYATGGVGVARGTASVTPVPGGLTGSYSDTYIGWTVGAGLELAVSENLSAKGEYTYANYGSKTAPGGTVATPSSNIALRSHAVKAGLNFHF